MADPFLDWIKSRKDTLRRELSELEAAERVYLKSGLRVIKHPTLPFGDELINGASEFGERKKTIKEAVLDVLLTAPPYGLTANEILDRLQKIYDADLMRTSLSPQLSRLKQEGKIVSERPYWRLAKREEDSMFS